MDKIERRISNLGMILIEEEMKTDTPTTDEYAYTDWLEAFNVSRFLIFIKETDGINGIKYKVQATTLFGEDGDEFDLQDKDGYSEWIVPAGDKDYQVVEEPWPKLRAGYKSATPGDSGAVTIRTVIR